MFNLLTTKAQRTKNCIKTAGNIVSLIEKKRIIEAEELLKETIRKYPIGNKKINNNCTILLMQIDDYIQDDTSTSKDDIVGAFWQLRAEYFTEKEIEKLQ
ncbi:MAG TPA: hypothetical protein ENI76_07780 [Ignavibacteria bacterium]|nr:hypothetical protein [Ignavibacteria bacterium]